METTARTNITNIFTQAQLATYTDPAVRDFVDGLEYSAILDNRTTVFCRTYHGRQFKIHNSIWSLITPANHFNCAMPDTEILTDKGFVFLPDIKGDENFITINPETHQIETSKAIRKIEQPHNGKMLHFKTLSFDLCVTPDHQMAYISRWQKDQNGDDSVKLRDAHSMAVSDQIPRTGQWEGSNIGNIKIGDLELDSKLFMSFIGWYLSEGSISFKSKNHWQVKISQCKEKNLNKYNEIFNVCEKLFGNIFNVHKWGAGIFVTGSNSSIPDYLLPFGLQPERYIPYELKQLSKEHLELLLDAFNKGDGSTYNCAEQNKKKGGKWDANFKNMRHFMTSSKQLYEDLGELIFKIGKLPSYYGIDDTKGKICSFKNGDYEIKHPCYRLAELNSKHMSFRKEYVSEIDYNGMVYCVELEKHNIIYVRRNGKCTWTGNCRFCAYPNNNIRRLERIKSS